jgi:acetyl-CoA synthetase
VRKDQTIYQHSISDNDAFWRKQAEFINWHKPFHTVKKTQFTPPVAIEWFIGGTLNIAENCIDKHLPAKANKTALLWIADEPNSSKAITYQTLHDETNRLANLLRQMGVQAGDVVTIYLPMIVEAVYAMLACARIGAVHNVVFAGFSPESLNSRMQDAHSRLLITTKTAHRGGKAHALLEQAETAIHGLTHCQLLLIEGTSHAPHTNWQQERANLPTTIESVAFPSEHPLFMLYTSGSTGKPKGVVHSSAGYLLYTALTHRTVFALKEDDIFWCTADIGWITGHSYVVYAPLANGCTTVLFEGIPTYPSPSRCWQEIEKHKITQFYTAPTAIRQLMAYGDEAVMPYQLESLRVIGSVGEPINPEAWHWYQSRVGRNQSAVVDTWWQTETGGHLITPIPHQFEAKPGSATLPFYGIEPVLLDASGKEITGEGEGALCIKHSWPSQARTVWNDHARFEATYFSQYPGCYFSGDGARRDKDGYYFITGRMDDVLNVSGHRLGTAEIEAAITSHQLAIEAAVVGMPHHIKGQGIAAFVVLEHNAMPYEGLIDEIKKTVATIISPIAKPDKLMIVRGLPKTRSGKIMRRILRKLVEGEFEQIGDTSTLLDPKIVEHLIEAVKK